MPPLVIKAGGGQGVDLDAICADVAAIVAQGQSLVLVHGTSSAADTLAAQVGMPVRQITSPSGHVSRYTDPAMLQVYVAAAAGQMNKRIVALLQRLGCNAVGLAGMDGRLLQAERKTAIRAVENGRQRVIRDDYTGKLEAANADLLHLLLAAGYTPVIAPLALGQEGEALNVDGDRAAALVAGALRAPVLVILSNVPGLLADFPDEGSLVRHIPPERLDWAEALAEGRMKKKLLAAREALQAGVRPYYPGRFASIAACAGSAGGARNCDWTGFAMNTDAIIALESAYTSGVYPKRPLAIVRGLGAHLWDADGREYIDCVGGQGAANLGHAHPAVLEAIQAQAGQLISCPEIFYNDRRAELLAALAEVAPAGLNRAFLCNSGAEAVEAALKFARLSTGRTEIVAMNRGFHGRTMGALSATWEPNTGSPSSPWCQVSATSPTTIWPLSNKPSLLTRQRFC